MQLPTPHLRFRGITLIEAMVTVAVIGILVAIGIPSFSNFIASSRSSTGASNLWSGIQLARSEAVRNNRTAYICPSSNGTSCAVAGNYQTGWLVWVDLNSNGSLESAEVLRQEGAMHSTVTVSNSQVIRYNSLGRPLTAIGAALNNVSMQISTTTPAASSRWVCISANGLPYVETGACP